MTADQRDVLLTPPPCSFKTRQAVGSSRLRCEASGGSASTPVTTTVPSASERIDSRCASEGARLHAGDTVGASEVAGTWDDEPPDSGLGKSGLQGGLEAAAGPDSIRDRILLMLFGDGEKPRASRLNGVTSPCTNRLVVVVRRVVNQLWKAREHDIRRSCGPYLPTGLIDEVDVLAYAVADVLGRPLLHPDDTNLFGKRVATHRRSG